MHVNVDYTGPERLDPDAVRQEVARYYRRHSIEAKVDEVRYRGKGERRARRALRLVKYAPEV